MTITDIESNMQLVEILERHQALRRSALNRALLVAESQNKWLGEIIVDEGMLTDTHLATILAQEFNLPFIDLLDTPASSALREPLPIAVCREHLIVPLELTGSTLRVAVANPQDRRLPIIRSRLMPVRLEICVSPIRAVVATLHQYAVDSHPMEWPIDTTLETPEQGDGTAPEPHAGGQARFTRDTKHLSLDFLLTMMAERNASDLHVTAGMPPMMRVVGELQPLPCPALNADNVKSLLYSIMTGQQISAFERQ